MAEYVQGESEDIWMDVGLLHQCREDQATLGGQIAQLTERIDSTHNLLSRFIAVVARWIYARQLEQTNTLADHYAVLTIGADLNA